MKRLGLVILCAVTAATVWAQSAAEILDLYTQRAREQSAGFSASAARGEALYRAHLPQRNGKPASCAACHTDDPKAVGRSRAFKPIAPLAPAVNTERLRDAAKVEKWLRRGCNDVLDRACTPEEKADVVMYLLSVR